MLGFTRLEWAGLLMGLMALFYSVQCVFAFIRSSRSALTRRLRVLGYGVGAIGFGAWGIGWR